ncbi:MAG: potassium transporter TrkG [Chloroflexota bacterium]
MKFRDRFLKTKSSLKHGYTDQTGGKHHLPVPARILFGLFALISIGTVLLMLPFMSPGDSLSFREAIFTAISALTVTGLSIISAGSDLTLVGQIILLLLIQLGGVGYMVIATLIMRFIGRRVFVLDRLALTNSIGLEKPAEILHILGHVIRGIAVIEAVGAVALYIHWRVNDIVPAGRVFFMAVFHSISAFCNAGFDLFGVPELYPDGPPKDNVTLIILGVIIFLGGLGIPVLSELFAGSHFKRWSLHTRVTGIVIAGLLLTGWLFTFLAETSSTGVLLDAGMGQKIVQTWFHSVSSRTAGFAAFNDFENITPATQMLTIILMFIGCAPASMGGGITTGTFAVLWIAVGSYTRGRETIHVFQRTVSGRTVRKAGSVLTISVGLVVTATFLIALTHPNADLGFIFFEVVSAFATCGLSLGFTGELNNFGLSVIAVMMVWGRLGALTIVSAVLQAGRTTDAISYPEESLLIG